MTGELPPIGSRWYMRGQHVEVVEHTVYGVDAKTRRPLPAVRLKQLRPAARALVTVHLDIFQRRAQPSGI